MCDQANAQYVYTPLEDGACTRVLILEPASTYDARLVATLENITLDSSSAFAQQTPSRNVISQPQFREFEAMSYAWEDQGPTHGLEMRQSTSAVKFKITQNVDSMLRHLRLPFKQRFLWIDALCINQNDMKERGEQVKIMGDIYRRSKAVIAWLGLSSDRYGHVEEGFFEALVQYADGQSSARRTATWETLHKFLQRTWFRRRWVIQEILLAKKATMMCGIYHIDFMLFARHAWLIAQRQRYFQPLIERIIRKLWIMYKLRSDILPGGHSDILSLLVEFASAECKDDRDRIYALNALTDVQAPVSYEKEVTPEILYTNYAEMHLFNGNLAMLNCGAAFHPGDEASRKAAKMSRSVAIDLRSSNGAVHLVALHSDALHSDVLHSDASQPILPSWVPDWRGDPKFTPIPTRVLPSRKGAQNAQKIATIKMQSTHTAPVLELSAVKVGAVGEVGSRASFPCWSGHLLYQIGDWLSLFDQSKYRTKAHKSSRGEHSNVDKFLATVSFGTIAKRANKLGPDHPWRVESYADQAAGISAVLAHLLNEAREKNAPDSKQNYNTKIPVLTADTVPESLKVALQELTYGPSGAQFDVRFDSKSVWESEDHPLAEEGPFARNITPNEFVEIVCRTIAGRNCFWTNEGAFGLGPGDMLPGDVVVAVPTCKTPYVLRPAHGKQKTSWIRGFRKSADIPESYTLVGDCYIHNFDPEELFGGSQKLRTFSVA